MKNLWGDCMQILNAPCKDCKDRHVGCHSECEKYKEFADFNRKMHDEAVKQSRLETGLLEAEIIRHRRNMR